jgi:hypothetical protein
MYFYYIEVEMREIITSIVLAIVLVGCSPKNIEVSGTQVTSSQGTPLPSRIPTPIASKGTVIGKIVGSSGQSLAGLVLYFGTILPLTPGPEHLVNIDTVNSPKTMLDADGRFILENLTPGEYVMVLWTPHESHFIPDPIKPEDEYLVKVVGGQIVDVGTLQAPSFQ